MLQDNFEKKTRIIIEKKAGSNAMEVEEKVLPYNLQNLGPLIEKLVSKEKENCFQNELGVTLQQNKEKKLRKLFILVKNKNKEYKRRDLRHRSKIY